MAKCDLNKKQRRAMRVFLTSTRNAQSFVLYLGIVQAYLQGMIDAGVKCKPIEVLAHMETEVPDECAINLHSYIRDIYEGHAPALSLKNCLSEKINKSVK